MRGDERRDREGERVSGRGGERVPFTARLMDCNVQVQQVRKVRTCGRAGLPGLGPCEEVQLVYGGAGAWTCSNVCEEV